MIRDADASRDGAACAAIYAPYVQKTPITFEEDPPDGEEMSRRIAEYGASHAWLVYERDGAVLGYAYACPHRERAAYRPTAEVAVYVAEGHHRGGIGRALYVNLIDRLRVLGKRTALAGITLPNEASRRLHEEFGFEPAGVFRNVGFKAGRWWDVGWWQLDLGEAPQHFKDW